MTAMPDTPGITLLCCGLLGCLVTDEGVIERSYAEAIATQGVVSGTSAFARRMAQVHQARGRPPGDVLQLLFPDNEARALAARLAFDRALSDGLRRVAVAPAPGVIEALTRLRSDGLRVAVLSGFSPAILDTVLDATGLRQHLDLALNADDALRGFPAPDPILTAVLRVSADAVASVAVADATSAGVSAGRRAGAGLVAGLLTGPHPAARLRDAGAHQVLSSFAELPALLGAAVGARTGAAPAGRLAGAEPPGSAGQQHSHPSGQGTPDAPPAVSLPAQVPPPRGGSPP